LRSVVNINLNKSIHKSKKEKNNVEKNSEENVLANEATWFRKLLIERINLVYGNVLSMFFDYIMCMYLFYEL
jgi:hypothetical protein